MYSQVSKIFLFFELKMEKGEAMIQILEGPSGSGKSYQIYQRIIKQSMKEPEKKFFLVVPEQFTMQAQRDIVQMHPCHGTMNIDIVSFNRLAYRVFEEQNIHYGQILEDFGKSMLLQRILLKYRKELPVFGPGFSKAGFIDELKSLLTELFQYRVSEQDLEEFYLNLTGHGMLKQKLHDLLFVYKEFQEEIKDTYIIAEHILEMLARHVPDSELLHESVLFLDGYTGFTPIQYDLLEALARQVSSMTITITIDKASAEKDTLAEHELFYISKDTIQRIMKLGERLDIYVEEEFLGTAPPRFTEASEILHLEKNIFRYPYEKWERDCTQIHIQTMKDTRQEFRSIARQIHAMVREGRYRYRDIAIIHGSLEDIEPIAEEILPKLNIPYFIDMNQSLYMNPCLESLRAILDIAEQDYSYDSVFRFLKTGVTGLSYDGIEQLENYCRKKGIRGENWWKRCFAEDVIAEYKEGQDLYVTMNYGFQVLLLLMPVVSALKQASSVQDYVLALQTYLETVQMKQLLEDREQIFETQGNLVQAKSYSQIYDKLQDIFEKLNTILGTVVMKTDEFHSLLDTGLNDIALGVIPPSLDQLTIGDIERTRLNHIQVLFVMGANDGIIPKITRGAGILSEADRGILSERLELAPDSRQQVFTEQFYLYQNITKPSKELYITYHVQDSDGNETLPAYLISRVQKLFPKLCVELPVAQELSWDSIETAADSRDVLVTRLHGDATQPLKEAEQTIWKALYRYYMAEEPEVVERLKQGTRYNNVGQLLTPETASRLYGDWLNTSVSKLEAYSKCPYQFFLEYGLKLHKRERNEVSFSDMGNLLHEVVETVFRHVETRKAEEQSLDGEETENPWKAISNEALRDLTIQTVEQIANAQEDQIYEQTSANRHLLQRMKQIAAYAVVDLKEQLLKGSMIPYQFELTFNRRNADELCKNLSSTEFRLEQGTTMRLNGIIDRIDICQDDSHVYVKVLDYKSSHKEIEMTQVSAGLQLQLLIYTNVVLEVLHRQFPKKEIIPAGSLYYGFKLPMIEKKAKDETTQKNIAKVTAMTGLVNEEEPCIQYMGAEDLLPVKSHFGAGTTRGFNDNLTGINAKETTENLNAENPESLDAESEEILNTERYMELLSQVQDTVKELGEDMMRGEIPIRPVKSGRGMPCDFCDYQDVCKLDCKDGGNRVVTAEQLMKYRKNRTQE